MVNFPSSLDSLTRPTATTNRDDPGFELHTVISTLNEIVELLEAKAGSEAAATDLLNYLRFHDGTSKGVFVLPSALTGLSPLVNGGFPIWQDGATFTSIASGTWGPDNWVYGKAGAVVHDLLRSTDVPTVAQSQRVSFSCQLDVTTADASIAAGDFATIATRIEGYRWQRFDQKIWSIRFWVKAAKTGIHYVYARNSGADRSCVIAYTVTAADTWEEKQVVFPANPSAGTWDYTNGRGLEIGWCLAGGSTFQTSAGAWATGDFKCASDQVNELDSASNNFRIAMVGRPTLGPNAMPYVSTDQDIELYRCKRYNEVMGGAAAATFGSGFAFSTTVGLFLVPMVPKRAVGPSIGALSGTVGNLSILIAGSAVALTAISNLATGMADNIQVQATVAAGLTANSGCLLYASSTESLRIQSRIP